VVGKWVVGEWGAGLVGGGWSFWGGFRVWNLLQVAAESASFIVVTVALTAAVAAVKLLDI